MLTPLLQPDHMKAAVVDGYCPSGNEGAGALWLLLTLFSSWLCLLMLRQMLSFQQGTHPTERQQRRSSELREGFCLRPRATDQILS